MSDVLRSAGMTAAELEVEARHLRTLAALAKDGLPQYQRYWDGWGVAEVVSVEGLKAKAARVLPVGELVLIARSDEGAVVRAVFSRIGGDNWLVPAECVRVVLAPKGP